jgi:hypothetical protein
MHLTFFQDSFSDNLTDQELFFYLFFCLLIQQQNIYLLSAFVTNTCGLWVKWCLGERKEDFSGDLQSKSWCEREECEPKNGK